MFRHAPRWTCRLLAGALLAGLALPALPADAAVVTWKLTLTGASPTTAGSRPYSGVLSRTPAGNPTAGNQTITLSMDGTVLGTTQTASNGFFGVNIDIPDTEPHTLVAIAFKGTEAQTKATFVVNANATAIAAGDHNTCVVVTGGAVRCWGGNNFGELGKGTTTSPGSQIPQTVAGLKATAVTIGRAHVCALQPNKTVKCWGGNVAGQLGDGTTTLRARPVAVKNLSNVIAITAGDLHTCAIIQGGAVKCWGSNAKGQLGNNSLTNKSLPTAVTGLTKAASLALGITHTCAVLQGGGAKCWGSNQRAELGTGGTDGAPVKTPVTVSVANVPASLDTGETSTCAVVPSGTFNTAVKCWGDNLYGQLGNGTNTPAATGVLVSGLTNDTSKVWSGQFFSCAKSLAGNIRCWGDGARGQLGNNTGMGSKTAVSNGMISATLALGTQHACGIVQSGAVGCWGDNTAGQLGDNSFTGRWAPVSVVGF